MRARVIVLKFGGSVLESEASLPRAVHEIYRWRREGLDVVAVVSAFAGETDRLLERARMLGAGPFGTAAAAATGEALAAALLCAALDRAGVPACVLSPAAIELVAEGDALEAAPVSVDRARLERALAAHGVAVVPGFTGVDRCGRTVLFGRGGSDMTALFLAHALGARCRLVKDVDGLYEWDPSRSSERGRPRRFATASLDDALATDGTILQHRAVRFAREHALAFEVARAGGEDATVVGTGPAAFASDSPCARPLRVALLGLGTVGGGVWRLVRELPDDFHVEVVVCRDVNRARAAGVLESIVRADAIGAARSDVDIVVECLGGLEPARSAIAAALGAGRDVVTANKQVLAEHGAELYELARAHGARLLHSAAVGGSAPVLECLSTHDGRVHAVRGVLSGSVNFVLERVAEGVELEQALDEARALGLTEADASRDLDGRDAADKLAVIAGALGVAEAAIERETLDEGAVARARSSREHGMRLRQLAEIRVHAAGATGAVRFAEIAPNDALFDLPDAANAAEILGETGSLGRACGVGAGRWPTAQSVLGDLLEIARRERRARTAHL